MAQEMYTEATNQAVDGNVNRASRLYERGLSMRQTEMKDFESPQEIDFLFQQVMTHICLNTDLLLEEV
jgi:hypothetical protein